MTEQGGVVVKNLRGDVVRVNKPRDTNADGSSQNNGAIRGQDFAPFGKRLSIAKSGRIPA